MNTTTHKVAVKDERWTAEIGTFYHQLTRTPGQVDIEAPAFLGDTEVARARVLRFAGVLGEFVGIEDPVAEVKRLREIERRWNAVHDAQVRTVSLIRESLVETPSEATPPKVLEQTANDLRDVFERSPADADPWFRMACYVYEAKVLPMAEDVQRVRLDFDDLMLNLSSCWHYGGMVFETQNERDQKVTLERYGYWPTSKDRIDALRAQPSPLIQMGVTS